MKIINQEQKEFWNEKKGDIWVSLEHNIDRMLGPLGDQAIKILKPKVGENIGACSRSLKNFGFKRLNLVSPKFSFPNHKAKTTSVGAYDIINQTKVFTKIEDAIDDYDIVIS